MSTVKMKLVGAIVVGGEVIKPPAIVEVSAAEAVNLAHRGKAVPATENDSPSATSPSAENAKNEPPAGSSPNPFIGATAETPVEAILEIGGKPVPVVVIGQDDDGSPILTDESVNAVNAAHAAALREAATAAAAVLADAEAAAAVVEGKTRVQKKADAEAVAAAKEAADAAEAAALAAEAILTPAT